LVDNHNRDVDFVAQELIAAGVNVNLDRWNVTTVGGISGVVRLPVRNFGLGQKIRHGGGGFPDCIGAEGEAHERAGALAERTGGALDRELPAGDKRWPPKWWTHEARRRPWQVGASGPAATRSS
jgi:hypothetical protein